MTEPSSLNGSNAAQLRTLIDVLPPVLTIDEVADLLRVPGETRRTRRNKVRELVKAGRLTLIEDTDQMRFMRFARSMVERYVDGGAA